MFVKRGEGENAIFILFFIISSCFLKNMPFFRLKYPFIVLLMLRYVECYISIKWSVRQVSTVLLYLFLHASLMYSDAWSTKVNLRIFAKFG